MSNYAIVLCGGSGTRLWPLSRSLRPKQLLCLNGDNTLLQQTVARLLKRVSPEHLFTVTHEDHKFEVKGQLAELDARLLDGVLAEPCARNTLPAIAWAVKKIHEQDPQAIIGVFPSDHAVGNESAFQVAWQTAEEAAVEGYLALIGIKPTEPATGYGYIQPGKKIGGSLHQVVRFVEKPDLQKARQFVEDGYLWNGGMFIFEAAMFMDMLQQHQPQIYQTLHELNDDNYAEIYEDFPNLSMDYGLAEKANNIAVAPADMKWSDLGSWDSIYQRQDKDQDGNLTKGEVLSMDTQNSLLWSSGGLVATLGVSNLAVIQTPDATLVCDRSRTEDIKQLVGALQKTHAELVKTPVTVHRPWGTYTVLEEGPNFKIKRIEVKPGESLSLQMHHHRSEHWIVVSGTARVINGDKELLIQTNESTYISAGNKHRLENPEDLPLVMIEVQSGSYLGEDDIVRFDDHYGRC
jgi:mannose-1-phosphate guanylyltransferase/mannose-6-phosphate isomerase